MEIGQSMAELERNVTNVTQVARKKEEMVRNRTRSSPSGNERSSKQMVLTLQKSGEEWKSHS